MMIGRVVVMDPVHYEQWLKGGSVTTASTTVGETPEAAGRDYFRSSAVSPVIRPAACLGPMLAGVFGHEVKLQSGETIVVDESYVRESLMTPLAKIVAGYQPIMPTYQGQLSEEQIIRLIAYIKSLAKPEGQARAAHATGSEG